MSLILSAVQLRICEEKSSVPVERLIERAAAAVVGEITKNFAKASVLVLCGPGNNGKEGSVTAELLKKRGWPVRVLGYGALGLCPLECDRFAIEESIVIDAIFGLGLSRPLRADLQGVVEKINASRRFVISIDTPTGINSDTGEVMGSAIMADMTVTFSCLKFAHVVSPGRQYCGVVHIKDIGLDIENSRSFSNAPALWSGHLPCLTHKSHKYNRGYAVVYSFGMRSAGAVKLAALAALRTGPGAVAVVCSNEELIVYAASLTSVMYKLHEEVVSDSRVTAVLIGPGGGPSFASLKDTVLQVLGGDDRRGYVLDAGAITAFQSCPAALFACIRGRRVIMTPHEGEFRQIFPYLSGSIVERAISAARESGAVVVLKGHDTVIAAPDGRLAVNNNAPASLATIGSGDVLAGMITGLLAAGMDEFHAACCAVWMHGECGKKYKLGLIADDIISSIPEVYSNIGTYSAL
ncbi:NAD(P)H-hydrate epimerase [Anaplasma platys]|uniref:Bifunctional NAD(P)H-hydrate repair enzyme n=1 Tax=Anaplasma platys TaxID=949 RepID=A0A858PY73_9RICK|nr:NAD(P)H-hydrate dehydratase [Anaplasma platys]QJC27524.1 NAD(P)H-hydrate epimerase [Anaplasma platys]